MSGVTTGRGATLGVATGACLGVRATGALTTGGASGIAAWTGAGSAGAGVAAAAVDAVASALPAAGACLSIWLTAASVVSLAFWVAMLEAAAWATGSGRTCLVTLLDGAISTMARATPPTRAAPIAPMAALGTPLEALGCQSGVGPSASAAASSETPAVR